MLTEAVYATSNEPTWPLAWTRIMSPNAVIDGKIAVSNRNFLGLASVKCGRKQDIERPLIATGTAQSI